MIILLSPAKSLDFDTKSKSKTATQPVFQKQAAELMKALRAKSPKDLAKLMKLSESLAELNAERNKNWKATHKDSNCKQAAYAFTGDVYQGLAIDELKAAEVKRCQKHVRILSGLYGMLRPLDLIQPYRLEMGTKLATKAGKNLYDFWDDLIAKALSQELAQQKRGFIVNLASNEYSKVAKLKNQDCPVISPGFREVKDGNYKMISFFVKRARGSMARFLIQNSVSTIDGIKDFDFDGYTYNKSLSKENSPMFTRKQPPPVNR